MNMLPIFGPKDNNPKTFCHTNQGVFVGIVIDACCGVRVAAVGLLSIEDEKTLDSSVVLSFSINQPTSLSHNYHVRVSR